MKIKNISWDTIYLQIQIEGSTYNAFRYYLEEVESGDLVPLTISDDMIRINITRSVEVRGNEMLPNGTWRLVYGDEGDLFPLILDESLYKNLEDLDKVFPYWNGCYAYIMTFEPEEIGESIICLLNTSYMRRNERPEKEYILLETNTVKEACKKAAVHLAERFFRLLYRGFRRIRKKDGKHILLMSETKLSMSGNLKGIDDRLKERELDHDFKISYSFHETLNLSSIRVAVYWLKLVPMLAKQDYIFIDDYAPVFKMLTLDDRTKLIQVWHAGLGFKSVGYSRFGKEGSPRPLSSCHRRYDYVIVGSKNLIPVYQEVFGLSADQYLPLGLPRIDAFLNEEKISEYRSYFYETYPHLIDKKLILFAPTYRGASQTEAFYPYDKLDIDALYEYCGSEYIFAFKMHPFISEKVPIPQDMKDRIMDFSSEDMNNMLHVCDILISDYSSVIYEFSLLDKPMLFYAFDKDFYEVLRGFHWDYETYVPGTICTDFQQLIAALQEENFSMEKVERFRQYGYDYLDDHSSDRLIDYLLYKKHP